MMPFRLLPLVVVGVSLSASTAIAWTGPSALPPSGNVSIPVNTGTAEQSKTGIIDVYGLLINGSSQYLNFGTTTGTSGFGVRNNSGTLEFKNSGGSWGPLNSSQWGSSGSSLFYNSGNVGIGTTTPSNKLSVGDTPGQSNALVALRRSSANEQTALEWGHQNPAGYASSLGQWAGGGQPFLCFNCEGGTNINTFRTRGIAGRILMSDNTGGLFIGRAAAANADNQSLTEDVKVSAAGNIGIGTTSPAARLTVGSAGASNNAYYDIGTNRIAVNESLYSYGKICAGESTGNCSGAGGLVISPSNIRFPDGTTQTTAAVAGDSPPGTLCGLAISIAPGYGCSAGQGGNYSTTFTSIATCKGVNVAASSCPSGYAHITPLIAGPTWDPNIFAYSNTCMRMCIKN